MVLVTDVLTALRSRLRADGAGPMVTFVNAITGERTELSATSLANAASKIANALRDEFDLDVGARVALRIPPHWQRATWLAGALVAGCVVDALAGEPIDADLVVAGPDEAGDLAAGGASVAVVSLHPFGLPITEPLPGGCFDVTLAVRQQPDAYLHEPPAADLPAWLLPDGDVLSQDGLLALGAARAAEWGLERGGRLLVGPSVDPADAWLASLVVPLAASASVILVNGTADLDAIARQERTTAQPPTRPGWS